MPQFDIATFVPQIFWLAVCFVFLLVFSALVGIPALEKVLKVRWQHIEGTLEEAATLQEQANGVIAALEAELEDARKKAHFDVTEAAHKASDELSRKKMSLAKTHKQRYSDGERVILQKMAGTMGYVQDIAAEVATSFTSALLTEPVAKSSIQEAIGAHVEKERRAHAV